MLYPDEDITNADWTKMTWDLPPYKSAEFNKLINDLDHFRTLPVYKFAVDNGLIVDDEWVEQGSVESYLEQKLMLLKGGPGSGFTSEAGHAGRPGLVGGSMHAGVNNENEMNLPSRAVTEKINMFAEQQMARTKKTDNRECNVYTVTVKKHKVKIYVPKDLDASVQPVTVEMLRTELKKLPFALFNRIDNINLLDKPNPDDAVWAREYNIPHFKSGASAGLNKGKQTIYFYGGAWGSMPNNLLFDVLLHESAHMLDHDLGNVLNGKRLSLSKEWATAMKLDELTNGSKWVSSYAKRSNSPKEDFADTARLMFGIGTVEKLSYGKIITISPIEKCPHRKKLMTEYIEEGALLK